MKRGSSLSFWQDYVDLCILSGFSFKNGFAIHSFVKALLLKAYISIYNFGITCPWDTYLDSSIVSDGNNLEVLDYDLIIELTTHPIVN